MGYRSDVAYYISFKDKEQRDTFMGVLRERNNKAISDELQYLKMVDNCAIAAYFADTKWYDSYENVQAHNRIMELALEWFPDDAAYKFVRAGEDDDDNETRIEGANSDAVYDKCFIVRRVECDWTTEPSDE